MRTTKPYLDWMQAALDGDLPPEQRAELERYLAEAPEAQVAWTALTEVDQLLGSARTVAPRPGFNRRFQARLAGQRSRGKALWGAMTLGAGAMASLMVVLALVGGTLAAATQFAGQPSSLFSMVVTDAAVNVADARTLANALTVSALALAEWSLMQPVMWIVTVFGLAATAVWLYLVRKLKVEVILA